MIICILAKEDGVNILANPGGTKFHHENTGARLYTQFTENTSAIKIRGKAVIYTKHEDKLGKILNNVSGGL